MAKYHFEDLWNKSEEYHISSDESLIAILEELMMKIELYKNIELRSEISPEEKSKIKNFSLGEILFTLTKISLKDNINTFEALKLALEARS